MDPAISTTSSIIPLRTAILGKRASSRIAGTGIAGYTRRTTALNKEGIVVAGVLNYSLDVEIIIVRGNIDSRLKPNLSSFPLYFIISYRTMKGRR